ncbi:MAG: TRAP transporter TatT component family protein [Treponema sp.]|nr:TRAP transporter TatT component family protein [Treponema sp.]
MRYRVEASSCKSNNESMKMLDEFKKQTERELPMHAIDIEQELLIFESLYVMERHHYLYDYEDKRPFLCDAMKAQMEKNENYLAKFKSRENANKWLYVLTGDVTSCYMTFSLSATLRYGFHVKDLYEKALKLDSGLSYALTNLGQWMFYAPKIFGGGKKKALKCFTRAVESSKNDGEQFFSDMYMSQFYFDRKKMDLSKKYFDKAYAFNQDSSYLELIKILNENGWSLFYYNRHRAGIDADIKNSNFKEPVDEDD